MNEREEDRNEDLRFQRVRPDLLAFSFPTFFRANVIRFSSPLDHHSNEQLVRARVLRIRRLAQDLGDAHLKVLLRNVLPTLAESVHSCEERSATRQRWRMRKRTGFGADTPHFGSAAVAHLFGESAQVDAALQGHLRRQRVRRPPEVQTRSDGPCESGCGE